MKLRVGFDGTGTGAYVIRDGKIECAADTDAGRADLDARLDGFIRSMVMDHGTPEDQVTPETVLRFIAAFAGSGRNWAVLEDDAPATPTAEALAALVGKWITEGGAAHPGGTFPGSEHFGLTEAGEPWVSEALYALVGEAARAGLTLVDVPTKGGGTVKRWVKVAAPKSPANANAANAHGAADNVLADPSTLDPADLQTFGGVLAGLPKDKLRDLSLKAGLNVGGAKRKLAERLLDHIKSRQPQAPAAPITGTAGGKPSAHIDHYDQPTPHFKATNPHATKEALGDPKGGATPNRHLPDDTRPAIAELGVAKHLNNYSWGYDGAMNKALRETGSPPPGPFGGAGPDPKAGLSPAAHKVAKDSSMYAVSIVVDRIKALDRDAQNELFAKFAPDTDDPKRLALAIQKAVVNYEAEGGKPDKDGPQMFADLQSAFKAAKPFGPPPITVERGITVGSAAKQQIATATQAAMASGGTVRMDGFQSTATGGGFGGDVEYTIDAIHGLDMRPYSHFPGENELLLNHGCQYKVLAVKQDGHTMKIHLQQVTTGV